MMPLDKRLARFGLSFHPFATALPPGACQITTEMAHVLGRCDHLVTSGGFALIVGDAGTGKSTLLRCLQARLGEHTDLVTGVLTRPQASVADFYRELGSLFGVCLLYTSLSWIRHHRIHLQKLWNSLIRKIDFTYFTFLHIHQSSIRMLSLIHIYGTQYPCTLYPCMWFGMGYNTLCCK